MDELIKRITEKTGISEDQARSAVNTVSGFLKEKLPAPIGRTSRQVPIYDYAPLRDALIMLYPDKAFLLPPAYAVDSPHAFAR